MGVLDDLEKMMMMEQMGGQGGQQPMPQGYNNSPQQPVYQPQGQMGGQRSPIASGSMSAIESAKHSLAERKRMLQMDDFENQRALGKSFIAMQESMQNNPHYGDSTSGNIHAMVSGLNHGLLNYDQERERIANANNVLLEQKKKEEYEARKEERDMKRLSHEMDIAHKKLAIDQGYFGLKKQESEYEKAIETEMSKSGATVPLGRLAKHPSMYTSAEKQIGEHINRGEAARNTLLSIRGAKKILTENPDITENMSVIMLAAQRNDPTIINQKLNKLFISEKTKKDAQMLSKYLSNIYTSKLPGMPARGMTKFLEQRLAEGSVDMTMAADAALELLGPDEETAEHFYKNGQKVYEELEKGNFYRPAPMKIKTLDENPGEVKAQGSQNSAPAAITEEQKQARIQELLKMREMAAE